MGGVLTYECTSSSGHQAHQRYAIFASPPSPFLLLLALRDTTTDPRPDRACLRFCWRTGSEVEHDTRYWLRPGKTYTAARAAEGYDFHLTHKKHSRSSAAFSIVASPAEPENTLVFGGVVQPPVYSLQFVPHGKPVQVSRGNNEAAVDIQPEAGYSIQDDDRIQTLNGVESVIV